MPKTSRPLKWNALDPFWGSRKRHALMSRIGGNISVYATRAAHAINTLRMQQPHSSVVRFARSLFALAFRRANCQTANHKMSTKDGGGVNVDGCGDECRARRDPSQQPPSEYCHSTPAKPQKLRTRSCHEIVGLRARTGIVASSWPSLEQLPTRGPSVQKCARFQRRRYVL